MARSFSLFVQQEELARTEITQPAILAHSICALRVLQVGGVKIAHARLS